MIRRSLRFLVLLSAASLGAAPPANAPVKPLFATPKTHDDLQTIQDQVQALIPKARAATVAIAGEWGLGSGVIVTKDGYVLTAGHVLRRANQQCEVALSTGKIVAAKTLGIFATMDAGLVKITTPGDYPFLPMGQSAQLKAGQWVLTIGHPGGYHARRPAVPRLGRILFSGDTLIGSDSPLVGGDSGGALVDLEGNVVGIHSRSGVPIIANTQVPVDLFHNNWDRLARGDYWPPKASTTQAALDDGHSFYFSPDVRKDSRAMTAVFTPIVADAAKATVTIYGDGRELILGAVVSPDGYIVTKASELSGRLTCRFADGKTLLATKIGESQENDLALLKVPATGLSAVEWADAPVPPGTLEGRWVATPGAGGKVLSMGIISLAPRRIPASPGLMGVQLYETADGPQIVQVVPDSPAHAAGLHVGDVITAIAQQKVSTIEGAIDAIHAAKPGTRLELAVHRGQRDLKLFVTLAEQFGPLSNAFNQMRGPVSKRASGFTSVLQHDSVLQPAECGGPLVDIDGKVVGINIARAGRAASLALPADVVIAAVKHLRETDSAPATIPAKP